MSFLSGFPLMGTLVNTIAVFIGSSLGCMLRSRVREDLMKLPMQCIGLFTMCIGASMALKMQNLLVVLFSLCIGSIIGGLIDIDGRVDRLANRVQNKYSSLGSTFSEGLIAATLIFCVGSMSVLGSFEEGLGGFPSLLLTKSMMDGLMALALSSSLGIGVMFSIIPLVLYQGTLTLAAHAIQPYMTEAATIEMSATGGVMLVGMGLVILGLVKIKLMDALPALLVAVLLTRLLA